MLTSTADHSLQLSLIITVQIVSMDVELGLTIPGRRADLEWGHSSPLSVEISPSRRQ